MSSAESTSSSASEPAPPSLLLSYLRLCRLPNVFTALADVAMGYFFTHSHVESYGPFLLLAAASACLYTAGMVLNDVFDLEEDRIERPERPLPSGRIDPGFARRLGFGLLACGAIAGAAAGYWPSSGATPPWRPAAVSAAIVLAVLLYDGGLKRTPLGPVGMGLCRFLNVLLGMSLAKAATGGPWTGFYGGAELTVAGGIGIYIAGVTWFARTEATRSARAALLAATCVMAGGVVLLSTLPERLPPRTLVFHNDLLWPALLAMLFLTILRAALSAVADPEPFRVQHGVRHAITSLILFDAAVTLAMRGPYPALGVLALLVPMKLLGRRVYST